MPAGLSISPYVVTQGDRSVVLTVTGARFARNSLVWLAGHRLKTTYVSADKLTAEVPDTLVEAVGTLPVQIGRIGGAPSQTESSAPSALMVRYRPASP